MTSAFARPGRALIAAAAATTLALGVSACGSDDATSGNSSSSASGSATASAAPAVTDGEIADVKVTGGSEKEAPKVTFAKTPWGVGAYESAVLKEGSGDASTDKNVVVVDYTLVNATSGKVLDESYSTAAGGFNVGDESLLTGLRKALTGVKKGERVVVAIPPADAFGAQGNAQAGIGATDTLVFAFDVESLITPLAKAEGTTVAPKKGLPEVTWNDGKDAGFVMPTSDPPTKLVIQPLIEGKGATVKKGQTAVVTYTGALWRDGKVFDSSFKHSGTFSFPVGAGKVIAGWDKGVEGQKVGSRLLLVVPPDEGYGSAGSGDIKGTDTIVFVVDILAAY